MIYKNACSYTNRISKTSVRVMMSPSFLDEIDPDKWYVTSFNPETRQVCVEYDNGPTLLHLTFTLPSLR